MSKRVTPKGTATDHDELPTLRERSPVVWWVAVLAIVGLVVGSFASALLVMLG